MRGSEPAVPSVWRFGARRVPVCRQPRTEHALFIRTGMKNIRRRPVRLRYRLRYRLLTEAAGAVMSTAGTNRTKRLQAVWYGVDITNPPDQAVP